MYLSTSITAVLLAASSLVSAAPTQNKRDISSLFGWSKPQYNYYQAVGAEVSRAVTNDINALYAPSCNMQNAQMPTCASPLPPVSQGLVLAHVAIGRGTQNYSCPAGSPAGTVPTPLGALASLYNVSCLAGDYPSLVNMMPSISVKFPVPTSNNALAPANLMLSGHHYFTDATTPFFNMITANDNYGTVAAKKLNATASPDGPSNVPWLKLTAKAGDWNFVEVYRVNTVGGSAPATCDGQPENVEVQYAAEYWLYDTPKPGYKA